MGSYFVFVDMDYYPYVGDPVEAESHEEALRIATENETPGNGVTVYVVPAEAVLSGAMHGPKTEPKGILKLMEESNALREQRRDWMTAIQGESFIRVVPGGIAP